ncbi:MAG: TPM domain-containing protein [Oscillospiraceae bacterium]|nr:TPM domain-containing protein [Oscillospiraceae bacterium]
MKLSTNRVVGIIAVVLAIVAAVALGQMRKDHFLSKSPTELLEVEYRQWICDEAKLLDDATVKTVEQYNAAWDEKYYAVVAVASVERMLGWDETDYAAALGQKWGLGENDMILVLVEDGDWQVYMGDYVGAMMQDYQQQKLRQAIDEPYYDGDFDGAVTAFFRQADVFYAQLDPSHKSSGWYGSDEGWYAPEQHGKEPGGGIVGVIFLILMIFVVWVLLDRVRYTRYRRRYILPGIVAPVGYYPIFWGRSLYRPARPRPVAPPPPMGGGYQSRPTQSRPMNNRPTGGFNGGGFSGGRRSGSSVRRSNGGGRSSRGGFGGGGFRGGRR